MHAWKVATEHLWFTMGKGFERLDLKEGDVVRFDACVTEYMKGYRGRRDEFDFEGESLEQDFRLSFPTKIRKVSPTKKGSFFEEWDKAIKEMQFR